MSKKRGNDPHARSKQEKHLWSLQVPRYAASQLSIQDYPSLLQTLRHIHPRLSFQLYTRSAYPTKEITRFQPCALHRSIPHLDSLFSHSQHFPSTFLLNSYEITNYRYSIIRP